MAAVEVFFLMMGLWLVVAIALGMRRPRGFGGAALRARLDAVYGEPHELARVSPAAFPEADLEFYDRARAALERKSYRWLADVEDLTLTRIYPQNRTFLRLFVDAGSMIRASVYHLHPRGVVLSMLQLVQLYPRHLRVIELVSEIQGAFLVTSNTHGVDRLEPPPEARIERLPLATSLDDIVKRHEQRITELVRAHPERDGDGLVGDPPETRKRRKENRLGGSIPSRSSRARSAHLTAARADRSHTRPQAPGKCVGCSRLRSAP